jgi:hypothetical protein
VIPHISIPKLAGGTVTNGPMLALIGDNPGGREVVRSVDSYDAELRRAYETGQRDAVPRRGAGDRPVKIDVHPSQGMSEVQFARAVDERAQFRLRSS